MILHPEQADELRRLLRVVEDWLLHASVDTLDELGGFLAGLGWLVAHRSPDPALPGVSAADPRETAVLRS